MINVATAMEDPERVLGATRRWGWAGDDTVVFSY